MNKYTAPPPPLVSLIIPVYNVESYLRECMDSVCNQTLKNIEIICIDDGSTDASGTILDEYASKDSRITVIHSSNKGLSSARNLGLTHARGEYIQFIDSDDYIAPTMSSRMYNAMIEHDVDIVMCGLTTIYEEGQEYRDKESIELYYTKEKEGIYPIDIATIEYTLVSVCVKMIKKSLLDEYAIRFLERKNHEDNYFTLAYLSIAKTIYFMSEKLYYRRFRNGSITDLSARGCTSSRLDLFYQYEHLFAFWVRNRLWNYEYARYFWNYYILFIYETIVQYPFIAPERLYRIVNRFVQKNRASIPRVPDLKNLIYFLSQFLGYEV